MDIERCNSIFELFAAFNFTYAILSKPSAASAELNAHHNSFVHIIDENLLKPFSSYIAKQKETHATKISYIEQTIETYSRNPNITVADAEKCKNLLYQKDYCAKKIFLAVGKAEEKKALARERINSRFPLVSFILALYCISILFLSTTESPCRHLTLGFIVILIFAISAKYFRTPIFSSRFTYVDYFKLMMIFLLGLLFITILHVVLKYYLATNYNHWLVKVFLGLDSNIYFRPLVVILSMAVPISHFIIYSISFLIILWTINQDNDKTLVPVIPVIDDLLRECEILNSEPVVTIPPRQNSNL